MSTFTREVVPRSPVLDVDAMLDDRGIRVLVCCGSGGVGKTTTAAALALRAAERGRSVVVLTIDPARRLAQSLGLTELDNDPRPVVGVEGSGSLDAMMLDMKRTFDEFVESNADPDRAATIIANPFYQSLSSSFAGTQEYMAMEKLGQLRSRSETEGRWDLVIVDTPPSRSALDFLDAPRRLGSFLDGRFLRILAAPAKAGGRAYMKVITAGFGMFTNVLSRVIGGQVLTDIQTFVGSVDTLFGGFRQRADETFHMLQAPDTAFLVVAAPERDALREASYFVERLENDSMPLAGLVLNRVQTTIVPELDVATATAAATRLEAQKGSAVTAALLRIHADRVATLDRQRRMAERFTSVHRSIKVATVPVMPADVVDLDGLRLVGQALADRL
ncbi:MAG: ArsA family ATPase [Candidatus Nanopelagicales bacterium]